jgi:methyltransferase (TIGR00027 family)
VKQATHLFTPVHRTGAFRQHAASAADCRPSGHIYVRPAGAPVNSIPCPALAYLTQTAENFSRVIANQPILWLIKIKEAIVEANGSYSRTAQATASMRAAHQLLDARPLILDDPLALRILGDNAADGIKNTLELHQNPRSMALRAHVVLRSRFCEDRLAEAVRSGVRRYLILGAGFDTFALRQPDWARRLEIVEIDHPATQAEKRSRMARSGLATPDNLRFIPMDFQRDCLIQGLASNGIRPDQPTFFSWLGVTMYLDGKAIDATLRAMASFPAGSGVTLSFMQPLEPGRDGERQELARRVAESCEPFVSFFTPEDMEDTLQKAGFDAIHFLTPEEIGRRYLSSRPADLPRPRRVGILSAEKGAG